jgi:hypothetical protein
MPKSSLFITTGLLLLATSYASAQLAPDDVAGAHRLLQQRSSTASDPLAQARRLIAQHKYREAEQIVDAELRKAPSAGWQELKTRLLIQAWRLDDALSLARTLPNANLWVGRVQLLQKNFDAALVSAKAAQEAASADAEAYLLEADVHFWKEKPELAEPPLKRALQLDPLNADARFAYGYAIWRRVDVRQLPAMAAQWNLALAIDPLHYVTHWHFGNGHTHLTYTDYAQPTDSVVRARLRGVDSLIAQERTEDALRRTRELQAEFSQSLLPDLARASVFYMAGELPRDLRLDSAQNILVNLLQRKPNYGPAHNALAAVIKQRQFTFVAQFDSLEAEIARQPVPADSDFYRVFKNIRYYPGERVEKMAVHQLGPALAYIPFLVRLGYTYVIPPLHQDLSEAMNTPFYRTSTTFDNRQWMDIRGSGGNHASAGIEYVERGSHQERVVLLHEYVHQFHGAVLTDQQSRRIRQLYYNAMANNRALDYYAANNESEFFAQAYEAYLSPVKVHPLNHKAMNTRADLLKKDPELFAFLDTLINENRAYLAGDRNAMRRNWAQVYVTLARQTRQASQRGEARWPRAEALLDSAALYERIYGPALLERAAVYQAQRRWAEADAALSLAETNFPKHAPVYSARAALVRERALAEKSSGDLGARVALYKRALELETDLSERADLNRTLRELYFEHAMWPEALALADAYVSDAPAPSTYLRDRKDDAAAFAADVRAQLGDAAPSVAFFDQLLLRKPQHYGHRLQAARVRLMAGDAAGALRLLEAGGRLLSAGGQRRTDYEVTQAEALARLGQIDSARGILGRALTTRDRFTADERIRAMSALVAAGMTATADSIAPADSTLLSPRQRRDLARVEARLQWQQQPAPTQQTARIRVTGRVIDESTETPVATAVVRLERVSRPVVTDTLGRFILDGIPSGKHRLEAERIGYVTAITDVELSQGDTLIIEMQPQPVILEAITALADRLKARRNRTPIAVRAYDLRTLVDYGGNLRQFLQSRGAFFTPCPRGRAGLFAYDCAAVRGQTVPVTMYLDEGRTAGPLDTFYPQEFELVEYYPSRAMVRVYTRTFLERVAKGKAFISPIL